MRTYDPGEDEDDDGEPNSDPDRVAPLRSVPTPRATGTTSAAPPPRVPERALRVAVLVHQRYLRTCPVDARYPDLSGEHEIEDEPPDVHTYMPAEQLRALLEECSDAGAPSD